MGPSVCLCVLSWYIILSHADTEFTLGFMYTAAKSNPPARRAMRTDNGVGEMAMIMPYVNFNGAGMAYRAMACTRGTFHPQQCPGLLTRHVESKTRCKGYRSCYFSPSVHSES